MWLMTTRGFYSVVEHRDDPARLVIEGGPHIRGVVRSALALDPQRSARQHEGGSHNRAVVGSALRGAAMG